MAEQFKAGDVVHLKSGSPDMTIENVGKTAFSDTESVWCVWFDGKKQMRDTFALEAVEVVPKSSGRTVVRSAR